MQHSEDFGEGRQPRTDFQSGRRTGDVSPRGRESGRNAEPSEWVGELGWLVALVVAAAACRATSAQVSGTPAPL